MFKQQCRSSTVSAGNTFEAVSDDLEFEIEEVEQEGLEHSWNSFGSGLRFKSRQSERRHAVEAPRRRDDHATAP